MNLTDPAPFMAYSVGLCYASVCTRLSDDEATARLNALRPTGVGPWRIADEAFADGSPNPSPCHDTPDHRHVLFTC